MHIPRRPQNFLGDYANQATPSDNQSPGVAHVLVRRPKAILLPMGLLQLLMFQRVFGLVSLFLAGLGLLVPAHTTEEEVISQRSKENNRTKSIRHIKNRKGDMDQRVTQVARIVLAHEQEPGRWELTWDAAQCYKPHADTDPPDLDDAARAGDQQGPPTQTQH